MPRAIAGLLLLSLPTLLVAGQIEYAEFEVGGGGYEYTFVVHMDADIDAVRAVVTDFENMTRLNDSFEESTLLAEFADGRILRRLRVNNCVLLFCFNLNMTETLTTHDNGDIEAVIEPAHSNFRAGTTIWRLAADPDGGTRLIVEARQEPDFWIPPVLGKLLLKRTFLREVGETCANIERFARTPAVAG